MCDFFFCLFCFDPHKKSGCWVKSTENTLCPSGWWRTVSYLWSLFKPCPSGCLDAMGTLPAYLVLWMSSLPLGTCQPDLKHGFKWSRMPFNSLAYALLTLYQKAFDLNSVCGTCHNNTMTSVVYIRPDSSVLLKMGRRHFWRFTVLLCMQQKKALLSSNTKL